jgi:hypothetical protein
MQKTDPRLRQQEKINSLQRIFVANIATEQDDLSFQTK